MFSPTTLVGHWKAASDIYRVIHQAELLPIATALRTWHEKLRGQRVLVFIDNDATRFAVIKGTSENQPPTRSYKTYGIWLRSGKFPYGPRGCQARRTQQMGHQEVIIIGATTIM